MLVLVLALALGSATGWCAPGSLGGHIKVQQQFLASDPDSLASTLGYAHARETSLDLRLIGKLGAGRFGFDADYLLQAGTGSAVEYAERLAELEPDLFVDREQTNWLPLDDRLGDDARSDARTDARQSLDRFSATLTTESWVLRLGRQAHSWGNGIVFRPFDIFDPFAPDIIDDSYKPGIDALYVQRLFANGSDVVLLAVPRRDPVTGALASAESSTAVKWHQFGAKLQLDWLLARDYRDTVAGFGISGPLGDAVWRLSVVPVRLDDGGTRTSLVVNFEHAWQWKSRNVSGFVEYFRNGFGRDDREYTLDDLEPALVARLARGQLFDTGRNYVAAGLRIQATALIEIDPVIFFNVDDRSALALLRGSYSLGENSSLDFGLRAAVGPAGTEFGGLPTSAGSGVVFAPSARIYGRLAHFF